MGYSIFEMQSITMDLINKVNSMQFYTKKVLDPVRL